MAGAGAGAGKPLDAMEEVARLAAELLKAAKNVPMTVEQAMNKVAELRAKAEKHRTKAYGVTGSAWLNAETAVRLAEEELKGAQMALNEMGYTTEEEEEGEKWVAQAEEELRGAQSRMEMMVEEEKKELDAAAVAEGEAAALEAKVVAQRELLAALVKGVSAMEHLLG